MKPSTDDLPESYKKLREKDEAFWVDQERNIQGALGQPCCTLSGISSSLLAMRGHFALVIHGEDECAGCFRHMGPSTMQLFCTGLTEQEFVQGRTAEPLRKCLRLVCTEVEPDAIFILGTCPVEVIGDRFETVVASVQAEFPEIPMRALHTSGLKVGTQTAMLDWFFETLASLPTMEPIDNQWKRDVGARAMVAASSTLSAWARGVDEDVAQLGQLPPRPTLTREGTVSFVGLPRTRRMRTGRPEYLDVLSAAGLRVIGNYPSGASLDDWRAIKFPKASFVADRSLYPRLVRILEESGQEVVEVPLPVGVKQTTATYEAVGRTMGRLDDVLAASAPVREEAEARVAAFRERFGGVKLAYGLRMNNNYQADELAYQGLGDYPALVEMGFDVTLLVQGPPDKAEKFARMYDRRGTGMRFQMFAEPWVLGEVLAEGGFQAAFVADHCRSECQKANVPMIQLRSLDAWYEGAVESCNYLERTLTNILR